MEREGGQFYFVRRVLIEEAARFTFERTPQTTMESFTPQEKRVLRMVCQGKSNKEIAEEMNLAVRTVKFYTSALFMKAHLRNRVELARLFSVEFLSSSPEEDISRK